MRGGLPTLPSGAAHRFLPAALSHAGCAVALDRETVASAIVGTGGAWLLLSALLRARGGRWTAVQRHGMVWAGAGFLLTASAARWLQHTGPRGIAVSLLGTVLAMRGMYLLVKERARLAQEKPRSPE